MTALFLFYIQDPPGAFPGFFTPGLGGRYAAGRLSGGVAPGYSLQGTDPTLSLQEFEQTITRISPAS
jgi:hypothetical protein